MEIIDAFQPLCRTRHTLHPRTIDVVLDSARESLIFSQSLVAYLDRKTLGFDNDPRRAAAWKREHCFPELSPSHRSVISTHLISSDQGPTQWSDVTCWCVLPPEFKSLIFGDASSQLFLVTLSIKDQVSAIVKVHDIKQDTEVENVGRSAEFAGMVSGIIFNSSIE